MKTPERELFELINNKREGLHGKLHIIDTSHINDSFRVYHADGYCFDVVREEVCDPEDEVTMATILGLDKDGCVYSFIEQFDGYGELGSPERAIKLMQS